MKNAEVDALVTVLRLLREIYVVSEINDDSTVYITHERYPDFYKDLLGEIEKVNRVLASGTKESSKDARIKELREALETLIGVAGECDSWESFPNTPLEEAYKALAGKATDTYE